MAEYLKKYEDRSENRDEAVGLVEANKRREVIPVIEKEAGVLLRELYGISQVRFKETGSIAANMSNEYSDIDLIMFIPQESKTINTIEITKLLNERIIIPYNVHVFPTYVGPEYFE